MDKTVTPSAPNKALDSLKWIVGLGIVGGTIFANSYYGEEPLLYRVLAMLVAFFIAAGVLGTTGKGASFIELVKDARLEARKIVWPDRQDTMRTTLFVVIAVFISSIILYLVDLFLGLVVSSFLG